MTSPLTPTTVVVTIALAIVLWACAATGASAGTPPTTLTVKRTGLQIGTITSSAGTFSCPAGGGDCSGTYPRTCTTPQGEDGCLPDPPMRTSLTAALPNGFGVVWSRLCFKNPSTSNPCSVEAQGTITAHFDDLSGPGVDLTAPAAEPRRGSIALSATATDDETGVTGVQFLVGDKVVATDSIAPYGVSYDTASHADGPVTVVARATNADGDVSVSSRGITIDNTAPALTVGGPGGQTFGPGSTRCPSWSRSCRWSSRRRAP